MPHIVPLYAALLALLFFGLSVRTIVLRTRYRVAIGDGDAPLLRRAMRVHANFAEYVPFCLVLFLFVELRGAPAAWVHGLCGALAVGRVLHAFAVSRDPEPPVLRPAAMALTFGPMVAAAAVLLVR